MPESALKTGTDCQNLFRRAYENRYSWDKDFKGYSGSCIYQKGSTTYKGQFIITSDFKPKVKDIEDDKITKLISSQLWEVAIHRVKRSFEDVHGGNTFTSGDVNHMGLEVLVGGQSKGDSYRIKDDIVTMVNRHMHGSLINILTKEIKDTGQGYLGISYNSQYFDPLSKQAKSGKCLYEDKFIPLGIQEQWVLESRSIQRFDLEGRDSENEKFFFRELSLIDN